MRQRKKPKRNTGHERTSAYLTLIASLIGLITALINLVEKLIDRN